MKLFYILILLILFIFYEIKETYMTYNIYKKQKDNIICTSFTKNKLDIYENSNLKECENKCNNINSCNAIAFNMQSNVCNIYEDCELDSYSTDWGYDFYERTKSKCKNGILVDESNTYVCPNGECNQQTCCIETCEDYDCKNTTLKKNPDNICSPGPNGCNDSLCCELPTCNDWFVDNQCSEGEPINNNYCQGGCNESKCCLNNCKQYNCPGNSTLIPENMCGPEGCTDAYCCDPPTCQNYNCKENVSGQLVNNPSSIICPDGTCEFQDCCINTCRNYSCNNGINSPNRGCPFNGCSDAYCCEPDMWYKWGTEHQKCKGNNVEEINVNNLNECKEKAKDVNYFSYTTSTDPPKCRVEGIECLNPDQTGAWNWQIYNKLITLGKKSTGINQDKNKLINL